MKNLKYILTAITILAIATVGFVLFNHPRQAGASWWNDAWSYRQALAAFPPNRLCPAVGF